MRWFTSCSFVVAAALIRLLLWFVCCLSLIWGNFSPQKWPAWWQSMTTKQFETFTDLRPTPARLIGSFFGANSAHTATTPDDLLGRQTVPLSPLIQWSQQPFHFHSISITNGRSLEPVGLLDGHPPVLSFLLEIKSVLKCQVAYWRAASSDEYPKRICIFFSRFGLPLVAFGIEEKFVSGSKNVNT